MLRNSQFREERVTETFKASYLEKILADQIDFRQNKIIIVFRVTGLKI